MTSIDLVYGYGCLVAYVSYIYIYVVSVFILSYYDLMITKSWKAEVLWRQGLLPPRWCWLQKWPRLGWNMSQDLTFSTFNFQPLKNSISWNIFFLLSFIFGVLKIIYHHILMFVWKFANIAAKPVAINGFAKPFETLGPILDGEPVFAKFPLTVWDSVRFGEIWRREIEKYSEKLEKWVVVACFLFDPRSLAAWGC